MGLHGLHESILIDALPTLKVAHFSGSQARVDARGTFETAGKRALHPLERANLKANAPEVKDFLQKVKLSRLEVRCGELVETARCCPRVRLSHSRAQEDQKCRQSAILRAGVPDRRVHKGESLKTTRRVFMDGYLR